MTRWGLALCGLAMIGATAAQAFDLPAAAPGAASPIEAVQWGGPMDDGPGYGGPGYGGPGYGGPGYGGPGYGGPGYGGPGYGGPGYGGPGYGMPPGMRPGYGMAGRGRPRDSTGPHHYVSYHGFRIDTGGLGGMDPTSAVRSVEHQIDIVDRVGVSPSMLSLFRSLPIRVSASFANASHYAGGNEVVLGGGEVNDNRPVLLHEYMHVLHAKRMPGGFHNPTILHFFEEARARGLYEQGSYMLSNQGEFFAMTASCFLNGSVARAPYTREAIREKQPDYYAYLEHLFGRGGIAAAARPARLAMTVH